MSAVLIYLLLGAVAGILAGLLGVGGGLVLVAALAWLLPTQGVPQEAAMHVALATSLASIVVTGLSSARSHHRRGSVAWVSVRWLVPGLLVGAGLGSMLAVALSGEVLRWSVAIYCFLAAAQLTFGQVRARPADAGEVSGPGLTLAGTGIGGVSALVGIGGGSMTVPLLIWLGSAPVRAVGTSSACGVFIALASAAGYALLGPQEGLPAGSIGYVFVPAAIGVALASVVTAPFGVRLAHWISGPALKRVFAGFLALIGISLIL
ncbi:MAG: sulfite exporter TauE/SafE family protein [Xanthomonadaceae bacterium]|nr:sulfite exporter TauE/SafE family protein [Xanthomonadaceae bacterium]